MRTKFIYLLLIAAVSGSAAAQEDDPFLQEFWRCAMSLRRDQQEMLLRLMREMGGQR